VRTNGQRHAVDLGRQHNHNAVRRAIAEHPEAVRLLGSRLAVPIAGLKPRAD